MPRGTPAAQSLVHCVRGPATPAEDVDLGWTLRSRITPASTTTATTTSRPTTPARTHSFASARTHLKRHPSAG